MTVELDIARIQFIIVQFKHLILRLQDVTIYFEVKVQHQQSKKITDFYTFTLNKDASVDFFLWLIKLIWQQRH